MRLARIVCCCMDDGRELALWHFGDSEQDEHCHESSSSNIRDETNVMVDIKCQVGLVWTPTSFVAVRGWISRWRGPFHLARHAILILHLHLMPMNSGAWNQLQSIRLHSFASIHLPLIPGLTLHRHERDRSAVTTPSSIRSGTRRPGSTFQPTGL